jgi:dipeptidase E
MRLYLSSYKFGSKPDAMLTLLDGKKTAVIMNAQDGKSSVSRQERLQQELSGLAKLGLEPKELDLRHYFGKEQALEQDLDEFDFVWVRGGNAFLLRRAYKQSGFDKIITKMLLNDEIAYGGYSAGICLLAPSLKGVELVDPTNELAENYDEEVIWDGLGLVNYAFAPHYKSDHPESEDINKTVNYYIDNHVLFVALRDGEAILVNGDSNNFAIVK